MQKIMRYKEISSNKMTNEKIMLLLENVWLEEISEINKKLCLNIC